MLDVYLIHSETPSPIELLNTNMIKRIALREEEAKEKTSHTKGGRVNKRGRRGGKGMERGCAELVPVLERLRPRDMRSRFVEERIIKRGRGGRGGGRSLGRGRGRGCGRRRKREREREAILLLKEKGSEDDVGVASVEGEACDVVMSGDGDGEEERGGNGLSEIKVVEERSEDGTSEKERREEGRREEERREEERGEEGRRDDGKWGGGESTSDRKDDQAKEFQMLTGVPKLRRTHAKSMTLAMMLSGQIDTLDADNNGSSYVSHGITDTNRRASSDSLAEKGKSRCSKDHAVNGSSHDEQLVSPLLAHPSLQAGPKTSNDVVATLQSIPKPRELSELTLLLTQPLPSSSTFSNTLTPINTTEPMMSSLMKSSTVPSLLSQGRDDEEYPQPSTNHQKVQRHLARQKQLADMRLRETALDREHRFLRRQGLLGQRGRNDSEHACRRVRWKEESELLEVFCYSPCSSRGSTLDPDEIPDSTDPT